MIKLSLNKRIIINAIILSIILINLIILALYYRQLKIQEEYLKQIIVTLNSPVETIIDLYED